jgi:mRNA-degrading endonuclease RelE of RelBE toxin-antitoxin system
VKFQILLHSRAAKFLKKLNAPTRNSIIKRIKELRENPNAGKRLKYSNFWSLRAGDYRAIYEIQKEKISILMVGHRRNVYDDFSKLF